VSILRHLGRGVERRDLGTEPWSAYRDGRIPAPGLDYVSAAGELVSERTATQTIDVYACVSLLSDVVSMLPAKALSKAGDVRSEVRPQPKLVAQPDPEMEAGDYWAAMTYSVALRGNAYSAVTGRDPRTAYPTSVKLLHPDDVTPRRNADTKAIEYKLANGDVVDRFNMIHVRWVTPPGSLVGLNPIECARRGIGLTIATERFGANWFRDGAAPSSVLETDANITPAEAKREVARWVATHGGRRKPALLSGGLKWKPVTINPDDSQWLESRNANSLQIAKLFRIPPHMVGHLEKSTSWGTGLEEQGIGFVVYTVGPHLSRFEAAFTRQMPRPQYMRFVVAALLRGNTRDRFLAYAIGRQWGWLSVNDIRELEDLPPVDGGETYLQPLNMIDAQEALKVLLAPSPSGGGK
jgi:HK97 family phage portal protein